MRRLFVLLVWLLLGPSVMGAARAESGDAAGAEAARALFKEGMSHADAGAWSEAIDRFQRALALRDSQVIRYNLAQSLVEVGRLVEALEFMRQVTEDASADAKLRAGASAAIDSLSPRIAKLSVRVEGPAEGVSISLDDRTLSAEQLGAPVPVDPGEHRLVAAREGNQLDAQSLSVSEGEVLLTTLHLPALVATPSETAATLAPVAPALPAPVHHDESDARRKKRIWWSVGGAAFVAVTVAVVAAVVASSRDSQAKPYQGDFEPKSVPVTFGP